MLCNIIGKGEGGGEEASGRRSENPSNSQSENFQRRSIIPEDSLDSILLMEWNYYGACESHVTYRHSRMAHTGSMSFEERENKQQGDHSWIYLFCSNEPRARHEWKKTSREFLLLCWPTSEFVVNWCCAWMNLPENLVFVNEQHTISLFLFYTLHRASIKSHTQKRVPGRRPRLLRSRKKFLLTKF